MQEMKDLLREGAETSRTKTRAEKRTTRQIENKIQKYKEKLKELSQGRKDDTIYFDDLGIDRLFVDEAHTYKALAQIMREGSNSEGLLC
jgi:N12 class adenine-specific DNA methylase